MARISRTQQVKPKCSVDHCYSESELNPLDGLCAFGNKNNSASCTLQLKKVQYSFFTDLKFSPLIVMYLYTIALKQCACFGLFLKRKIFFWAVIYASCVQMLIYIYMSEKVDAQRGVSYARGLT